MLRKVEKDEIIDTLYVVKSLSDTAERTGFSLREIMEARDEDPEFDERVNRALKHLSVLGEEELMRRAIYGVEEFVVSKGRIVMVVDPETGERRALKKRIYSDSLLLSYLKARQRETYGDKLTIENHHKGHIALPVISPEDFESFLEAAQQKQIGQTAIDADFVEVPAEKDEEL